MFKLFSTLARGRVHEAAEATLDRQALPLLRQQIRDCAHGAETSRRAIAVAMAQNEREKGQHTHLLEQIEDLEERAIAALEAGKDALAREAASAIAVLEEERDISAKAQSQFNAEITRLRDILRSGETRLRQLQRGQRLVTAAERTQKMRAQFPNPGQTTLREAETTLDRLLTRQAEFAATARAMMALQSEACPQGLRQRLSDAGFGAKLSTKAEDVLNRLKKQSIPTEGA